MSFSAALTLTDLNDFINPSQACIKPVEAPTFQDDPLASASTKILIDSSGSYFEASETGPGNSKQAPASSTTKLTTAQITLNDCLACSGCITSAESVLVSAQSHQEVFDFLASNPDTSSSEHKIPVISISPQSLASLAVSLASPSSTPAVSLAEILSRVKAFCKQSLGFEHVFDTTFARHITLLEHSLEFRERRLQGHNSRDRPGLPMLAGACPGWICYAEKTHPEIIPFISCSKSPQQVMGTIVKEWLAVKWGKRPDQIYHVTVMPCYDKKLEASRPDFYNDTHSTREVDCVITTGELQLMMRERGWDITLPVPSSDGLIDAPTAPTPHIPELVSHPGSSSGSYLQSLVIECLSDNVDMVTKVIRNADYEEVVLTNKISGEVVFKGAKCYGFKNLQNLVRKVGKSANIRTSRGAAGKLELINKRKDKMNGKGALSEQQPYDYVEVMACPGGCVNGGGQIRPSLPATEGVGNSGDVDPKWGDRQWTKLVEKAYWHDLPTPPGTPTGTKDAGRWVDEVAWQVLQDLCRPRGTLASAQAWPESMDEAAEELRRHFFRTQYRAVEKEVNGLQVQW